MTGRLNSKSEEADANMVRRPAASTLPVPRVSVVIPTYKRAELVRRAVLSLFAQDLEKDQYEIIVVDSSPDQQTVEVIEALESTAPCTLRLLVKEPEGPGPSRGLGVKHAIGEYIAFMDSDCQASPGWLRAGLRGFTEGVGIVQGRTEPDPEGVRGVFTWYVQVDHENFVYECCNIFYRRRALEEAGELRPSMMPKWKHPPSGEDVEMAWKVKRIGWNSCFVAEALVYHERVRVSPWRFLIMEQLFVWPGLVGMFPELREFFYGRYFFDRGQAFLLVALFGVVAGPTLGPIWLAACVPYLIERTTGPSKSLRGVKRLLRAVFYIPRDIISLCILLGGSVKYRSVLL